MSRWITARRWWRGSWKNPAPSLNPLRKSTWRRHSTCWARPGAKWSLLPSKTVGPTPSKKHSTKKSRKIKRKMMTTSLGLGTSSPSSPVPAKPLGTYNKPFYTWRPTLKLMTWSWPSWDPSSPSPNVMPAPSSPSSRTSSWRQPSGTDGLLRYSLDFYIVTHMGDTWESKSI